MNEQNLKSVIRTYRDFKVYQLSYSLAMEIFEVTKSFPKEEVYSLTNQIRRSSRSIPANIGEGWTRRRYVNIFVKQLVDANGSCEETKIWLEFSKDCQYLRVEKYRDFIGKYNQIGAMLNALLKKWRVFEKKEAEK